MVSLCPTGLWSPPPPSQSLLSHYREKDPICFSWSLVPGPVWGRGWQCSQHQTVSREHGLGDLAGSGPQSVNFQHGLCLLISEGCGEQAGGWLGTAVPVLTLAVWRDTVFPRAANASRGAWAGGLLPAALHTCQT